MHSRLSPKRSGCPGAANRSACPSYRISLDATVLNPRSHRIRAQLESDAAASRALAEDPEGEAAQNAIARLLRDTAGFEALKQNLSDDKQRVPGIITREGRLINANCRAVALRDLGEGYVEVAVLPPDATIGEVYDLELDLQVAQDFRQDYSFTNELLFVEDLITEEDCDELEVAVRHRWATRSKPASVRSGIEQVRRYVRHLDLIREIQAMSGGKVRITDFDDAEQTLREFDTAYEAIRTKDPHGAQQLKQARTLGLLVDLGYQRQRAVDAQWVETHLAEALAENEILGDLVAQIAASAPDHDEADEDSDLGDLAGFEEIDDGEDTAAVHRVVDVLVTRLGESAQSEVVRLPTDDGEREFDRETICAAINDAMRTAAEDAKNAARAGSALQVPVHLVEDAAKQLARARQAYDQVSTLPGFDAAAVRTALARVARALEAIEQTVGS